MEKNVLDMRGVACPGPVIEAKKALENMEKKELEVLVDNQAAVQNLTRLGSYMGLEIKTEQRGEKEFSVLFQENGQGQEQQKKEEEKGDAACAECASVFIGTGKKTVVISSDTMGSGDDVLGRLLMKSFIYALTELKDVPERVILYNGGAKLSIEGSSSLEDLRHLESQGAEILTCGTCLNHYQITDKLAVGRITNMYEIAEKMMGAEAIIRP